VASIRQLGACLGLPERFSIVRHFFGYATPPPWPTSQTNVPKSISLLTQAKLVRQPHFNLHLIRVGTNDQGDYPQANEDEVDAAVQLARRVFAEINVGIGRVKRWWYVALSEGTGYEVIDDDCEADDLIDAYDLPSDGIKVYFVLAWLPCFPPGLPPVPGSTGCTVGRTDGDKDGSVVLLQPSANFVATGRTLAHELGHVLGFGHENGDPNNLMCQGGTAKNGLGITNDDNLIPATTGFYDWQVAALRGVADGLANAGYPPGMPLDPLLDPTNPALQWMYVRC
jgi:hypothetical protein